MGYWTNLDLLSENIGKNVYLEGRTIRGIEIISHGRLEGLLKKDQEDFVEITSHFLEGIKICDDDFWITKRN